VFAVSASAFDPGTTPTDYSDDTIDISNAIGLPSPRVI